MTGANLYYIFEGVIIGMILVMVEVVLVIGQPTSIPLKFVLEDTGIMGSLFYLIVSAHHPSRH